MGLFDIGIFPGTEFFDAFGGTDSQLWLELFVRADKINPDLSQRLMYLRNVGCRLQEDVKFGFVIVPVVGKDGWESRAKYDEEKQCLVPYRMEVIRLLKGLRA